MAQLSQGDIIEIRTDFNALRDVVETIAELPDSLREEAAAVVRKAAVKVKKTMQEDMAKGGSGKYFGQNAKGAGGIHPLIDFDWFEESLRAEIGPNYERIGKLAAIAYWGGSRGGGGSVREPDLAMREEEPHFYKYMEDILDKIARL